MTISKSTIFDLGLARITQFCERNSLLLPTVYCTPAARWSFAACAYYRPGYINICVEKCAAPGTAGRSWSWPGYTVDRTPFGVLAHELGHHADRVMSIKQQAYSGDFGVRIREESGEDPLTTYCPNDAEWFAEHFRLFVTNPDLLRALRPRTYAALTARLTPVVDKTWQQVLEDAPARTIAAAQKKVDRAKPGCFSIYF